MRRWAPRAPGTGGDSPALQVAEVHQVELPAVLAVVDVVHVLPEGMDTGIRLSSCSGGGFGCLALLEQAEPLGILTWEGPCLNPEPKP